MLLNSFSRVIDKVLSSLAIFFKKIELTLKVKIYKVGRIIKLC